MVPGMAADTMRPVTPAAMVPPDMPPDTMRPVTPAAMVPPDMPDMPAAMDPMTEIALVKEVVAVVTDQNAVCVRGGRGAESTDTENDAHCTGGDDKGLSGSHGKLPHWSSPFLQSVLCLFSSRACAATLRRKSGLLNFVQA